MSVAARAEAAKFRAESLGKERRLDVIMCRVIERGAQFASLRRHQHASAPEIGKAVKFDFSYRGEDVVGHPGVIPRSSVIAKGAFGIAFEFDIFVDLPLEIDTGIVDAETGPKIVGIPVFHPYSRTPETNAEREPFGVIDNPLWAIRNLAVHCERLRQQKA